MPDCAARPWPAHMPSRETVRPSREGDKFDEALGDFAFAYAEQTVRDHAALVQAVNSGRLAALIEEEEAGCMPHIPNAR